MKRLSATEVARNLSALINRVVYRSEEFLIERGGEAVCRLVPVAPACSGAKLSALLAELPRPDKEFWDAVEDASLKQPAMPPKTW